MKLAVDMTNKELESYLIPLDHEDKSFKSECLIELLARAMKHQRTRASIYAVVAGAPLFINEVNGLFMLDDLAEIELTIQEDYDDAEEGMYGFECELQPAQVGDFGRIEIPEHWEVNQVSFQEFDGKELE